MNLFRNFIERIREKTREEYVEVVRERYLNARIWIQEHSEKAVVISLVAGIVLVLFFKLVAWLLFLVAVAALIIWLIARPGVASPISTKSETPETASTAPQSQSEKEADETESDEDAS